MLERLFPLVIVLAAGIFAGWMMDDFGLGNMSWKTVAFGVLAVLLCLVAVGTVTVNR